MPTTSLGSGLLLKKAIARYGEENFQRKVLHLLDSRDSMDAKEAEVVTQEIVDSDEYYNLCIGGAGGMGMIGKTQSDYQKQRAREANSVPKSKQHIENHHKSLMETLNHPDYVHPNKGKPKSEVHRKKITEAVRNRKMYKCEVCGKEMRGSTNYKRWHGPNCKNK